MALHICADCGKDVSDQAPACPHCGRPAPVDDVPVVKVPVRRTSFGEPALLMMGTGGVLLAAGFVLLITGMASWASAFLLTGIVLGVGGRISALFGKRKRSQGEPS